MLQVERSGKRYLYSTDVNEADFVKHMLKDLFGNVCNRQKGGMIAYLLSQVPLSHDDIESITRILNKKRDEAVDVVPCNCLPGQCHCRTIKEK